MIFNWELLSKYLCNGHSSKCTTFSRGALRCIFGLFSFLFFFFGYPIAWQRPWGWGSISGSFSLQSKRPIVCSWLYRQWERGCHEARECTRGGFTRAVPKQKAAVMQLPRQRLTAECNYSLEKTPRFSLGFQVWYESGPSNHKDFFFYKASKKNLHKCEHTQCSVFVPIFYGVLSVCAYICTGPWKLYLPTESCKYVIFSHELFQHYETEKTSKLKYSPAYWFSHSTDTSVTHNFDNGNRSAWSSFRLY